MSNTEITIREILADKAPPGLIVISGWVRTHRQSKNISFIELNDGSSVTGLQVVIEPTLESYRNVSSLIATGSAIKVQGELAASPAKGQKYEIKADSISLIGEADPESYPLQKKGHSLEFLREILHLRPRSKTMAAVLRLRSYVSQAIHRYYHERGFYYITTPIITTSDCEGAGEMFRVTTLNLDALPKDAVGKVDFAKDFFSAQASLTVSGQLEGESCALGLGKIYTFGPTFRAENSNTTRHLAEFWMVEPEMAFYDLEANMRLAEDFIKEIIRDTLGNCHQELEFFQTRDGGQPGLIEQLEAVVNSSFTSLDYTQAIDILIKSGKNFEYPVKWGIDLQSEHERYLTDEIIKGPVIVVNYPKEIKAFYMRLNEDQKTVRAMDVLVPRLGEIIGGAQREEREGVLRDRIIELGLPVENYSWYLELRRWGSVPHAGFGLGLERLLMYLSGMSNIRDVIPFPRFPGFARF